MLLYLNIALYDEAYYAALSEYWLYNFWFTKHISTAGFRDVLARIS
jgi:hypothetical protein